MLTKHVLKTTVIAPGIMVVNVVVLRYNLDSFGEDWTMMLVVKWDLGDLVPPSLATVSLVICSISFLVLICRVVYSLRDNVWFVRDPPSCIFTQHLISPTYLIIILNQGGFTYTLGLNSLANLAAHEVGETRTDPLFNNAWGGWYVQLYPINDNQNLIHHPFISPCQPH